MKIELQIIINLLLQTKGIDISIYEEDFLKKTIDKRLLVTGNNSYEDYCRYLTANKNEPDLLLNSFHNAFSEFFRNPLTFAVLEQIIFPSYLEKKKIRKEKDIRIWSSACAAGQEAYSLAILFDEMIETSNSKIFCRIFATDKSPLELTYASMGVYQTLSVNKVSLKRIQKYFTKKGDIYTISQNLRKYIDFSVFDLLANHGDSPPASIFGDFDVIFCSNILFYYKPEYRIRILEKMSKNLSPGGFLITGEAEREIVKNYNFKEVFPNSAVFQKIK